MARKQISSHDHRNRRVSEALYDVAPIQSREPAALESQLSLEALRIIRTIHPSVQDIGERYFNGPHTWIPFLCPSHFQKILAQFESSPTEELALLLLCTCLVTYDPTRSQPSTVEHEEIYLNAKMLFTQIQVLQPPSIHLIHAAIFISIYEYARRQLDQALATIDLSARMAYKLGLHLSDIDIEWNTWWATRIFERIMYCEVPWTSPPMITSAPDEADRVPSEVGNSRDHRKWPVICLVTPANLAQTSCLGRAALATYLLDRVIQAVKDAAATTPISTLISLDVRLQQLLSATIDKCHGKREGHCGAVGISIRLVSFLHLCLHLPHFSTCKLNYKFRALFLLHEHFLHIESKNIMFRCREHSEAAIHTAAQMVLDMARSQQGDHVSRTDYIPPIFGYLFRYALKHFYEKRYEAGSTWLQDSVTLRQGLGKLNRRWSVETEFPV